MHYPALPPQVLAPIATPEELAAAGTLRLVRLCFDLGMQNAALRRERVWLSRVIAAMEARRRADHEPGQLRCGMCRHWLEPEAFVCDRTTRSGRRPRCRACDAVAYATSRKRQERIERRREAA
jgi:hypothetical protein